MKPDDKLIIVMGNNWNPGVIGIDTDRLKDRFLRPAIILTEYAGEDYLRGSCRSIPTINMYEVIEQISDSFYKKHKKSLFQHEVSSAKGKCLVDAFGGHAQACGFSLHKDNVDEFTKMARDIVAKKPKSEFRFSYEVLDTLQYHQIDYAFLKRLERLGPYGQHFEYPTFNMTGCQISKGKAFGNRYQKLRTPHVEFKVFCPSTQKSKFLHIEAVGFSLWDKFSRIYSPEKGLKYNLIFTVDLQQRRFRSKKTKRVKTVEQIRLNVLDIRLEQASKSQVRAAKAKKAN